MKKIIGLILVAMLSFSMTACGGSEETPNGDTQKTEVDAAKLAEKLVTEGKFEETPAKIEADEIAYYMEVAEGVEGIMYMSGGTTGEEVAVFTAKDKATATEMKANVEAFLADQSKEMGAYDPKVVQRIENAVLVQKDKYVILCVSEDSTKAKSIIEDAF